MRINGIMIDCSRLIEQHKYYYRLIDFMVEWKMNILQMHFNDDHGLSIRVPGFSELAAPHAFTTHEIKMFIAYASERGIEIIPEVAAFGHIRYLTDDPKYSHLQVARETKKIVFNAIDPCNPESVEVIERLIKQVVKLFPGKYLHVGCDEVDLTNYCKDKPELDPAELWSDYVNKILSLAVKYGRTPLFWADHPVKDRKICKLLNKDCVAVWWDYIPGVRELDLKNLTQAGFKNTITAPSVASWHTRFLAGRSTMTNTGKMARFAARQGSLGVINTIWCPFRYVQGSLYYGLAYCAEAVRSGGKPDIKKFNAKFVRKTFGRKMTLEIELFIKAWPDMELTAQITDIVSYADCKPENEVIKKVENINKLWYSVAQQAEAFKPSRNLDIWNAMKLAADASGIVTEWIVINRGLVKSTAERRVAYNDKLKAVRSALSDDWDATRYADDPAKKKPRFTNEPDQMMLLIIKKLPKL